RRRLILPLWTVLPRAICCWCMAVWQLANYKRHSSNDASASSLRSGGMQGSTKTRQAMNDAEGSEYDRLFYPFLFEGGKASIEDVLAQVRHSTLEKCREVIELRRATLEHSGERIIATGRAMAQAFAAGATLLAFGNGGSTTDAQDLVTELLNPPFAAWSPLPAIALTNDIAVVTAVGNDVGFDNVYARQ